MTSLRVGFLGMLVVVAVAACARSHRVTPSMSGEGGAGEEAGAGGTGGSAGNSSGKGGASGAAGKDGSGGGMTADAGEGGASRGGGSSGAGTSAGRGGSSEGGESGEAGGGGVAGVDSVLEINDAQWAAFCQGLFDCPMIESDEAPGLRALLGDEATCRQILQGTVTGRSGVSDLAEAVEQGRVVLKLDELSACLEAWSSCDFWRNRHAASAVCRRVFQGTQATGEACFRDEECAVGRCVVADACPGTCQPLGAPGEVCATDDDCDGSNGLASCEIMGSNVPDACYVTTLLPPVGEGEECWRFSEGEGSQPCASGLWCEGDGIYAAPPGSSPGYEYRRGLCRSTPIPGGEACDNDEDVCELGYFCRGEDTDYRCEAIQVVNDVGAPCGDVAVCNVFERLECVSGLCERTTDGLEGSSCQQQQFLGYRACEPGLVCVAMGMDDPITTETPQVCLLPRATGESCRRDHECASQTCGSDNRCADRFCETARQWF
jgi:hypothetical protein